MFSQQEEHDCGPDASPGSIREYVNSYKTFSENFTTVLKLVMSEELNSEILYNINSMVGTLKQQINV